METYLDKEIKDSLIQKANSYVNEFTSGRQVEILDGKYKGKRGVIQNVSHDKNFPLLNDKIRVWIDGFSCVDIFDFEKSEIKVIPYQYVSNLGYY